MPKKGQSRAQKAAFVTAGEATHETPFHATHLAPIDTTHETPKKTTRRYKPRARKCACGCGVTFTPKTRHGRYASANCRKRAHARRRRTEQAAPIEQPVELCQCLYCGATFFAPEGNGQLYCKPAHRTAAWRDRREATIRAIAEQHGTTREAAERHVKMLGLAVVVEALRAGGYVYRMQARQWVKRGKVLQFERAG